MKIHFAYAGSPEMGEIRSPYCITRHLYKYLQQRAEVVYYEWSSGSVINTCKNDVVIGHPNYHPNTPIVKFFNSNQECRVKCTIHPFHSLRVDDNFPFDPLVRTADAYFAICGQYWYDTIGGTAFSHWKEKMVRLDMAVNKDEFPFVRTKFNPPGQRKLVYIGSSTPHKNLNFMTQVMQKLPNVTLHWYGGDGGHPLSRLPNVKAIGATGVFQNIVSGINPKMAKVIVDETDIFINTSISDANPTTLLETTAWGCIGACTPQSGYYNDPMFEELSLNDIDRTIATIKKLLYEPSEVLMQKAIANRRIIEENYNWDVFCNKVWTKLKELYESKS